MRILSLSLAMIVSGSVSPMIGESLGSDRGGSRFVYLDERDPYYPHPDFPKLTVPMWVGEKGVEAVILLSVDDLGRPTRGRYDVSPAEFERFLTPLIKRLQEIDGRAPITLFTCQVPRADPVLQRFLKRGLSLEVHSYTHPVPLLRTVGDPAPGSESLKPARNDFVASVQNLFEVPNNRPVAYRMPGCDAQNTNSPRFYTEVFPLRASEGQFLTCDSSIMTTLTSTDPTLPRKWLYDSEGRERFRKYVRDIPQTKNFANFINGYPYPYPIDRLIWEFPVVVPADSHGVHKYRAKSPRTVEDWKRAVDIIVHQRGVFTLLFHTIGYIEAEQVVEVIDYADRTYGGRVKFLNCREIYDRITKNALGGEPLRSTTGGDNGVRLLDVNADGFLDVVIGNSRRQETRVWQPKTGTWRSGPFPTPLVIGENTEHPTSNGIRFFTASRASNAGFAVATPHVHGVWQFAKHEWVRSKASLPREVDGKPLYTAVKGIDRGVRFRGLNDDGFSDLIVNNESQNAVFFWKPREKDWRRASFALPETGCLVDASGIDQGLRFVDLDGDTDDDLLFSNERLYWVRLFEGPSVGWSKVLARGKGGMPDSPPAIVQNDAINGVWFHLGAVILENEFTAKKKDSIERIPFEQLLRKRTGDKQP